MVAPDGDDLIRFPDVHVIRATTPAMLCQVAGKRVWISRRHVSGKLWCAGDRGTLFLRRSLARDLDLLPAPQTAEVVQIGPATTHRPKPARPALRTGRPVTRLTGETLRR
jgi:hypothetical protein